MTTYNITVNETEKATTTSFDAMCAFIENITDVTSWNLDMDEDGVETNLRGSGINARYSFSECKITYRMGR